MHILRTYPKLLLLCLSTAAAYLLYISGGLSWLHDIDHGTGEYISLFVGGMLFTFGFTAPFGVGVFVEVAHAVNPFVGSLIGGLGALTGDLVIFHVLRFDVFQSEIDHLRSTRLLQWLHTVFHHERFPEKARAYFLWIFAGIIIASPLPDEFGVALVSAFSDIRKSTFAILSFTLNMLGILTVIEGARFLGA